MWLKKENPEQDQDCMVMMVPLSLANHWGLGIEGHEMPLLDVDNLFYSAEELG